LRINYRTSAKIRRFSDALPAKLVEVDGEQETRQTISILRGPEPGIVAEKFVDAEIVSLARWSRDCVRATSSRARSRSSDGRERW
jgi:hypothetical protein